MAEGRVRNKSSALASLNSSYDDTGSDALTVDDESRGGAQDVQRSGSSTMRVSDVSQAIRITSRGSHSGSQVLSESLQECQEPFPRTSAGPFLSSPLPPAPLRHSKSSACADPANHPSLHLLRSEGRVRRGIPQSSSSNFLSRIGETATAPDPPSLFNRSVGYSQDEGRVKGGQVHERFSGSSRVSAADLSTEPLPLTQASVKASSAYGFKDLVAFPGPSPTSSVNPSPRYTASAPLNPFDPASNPIAGLLTNTILAGGATGGATHPPKVSTSNAAFDHMHLHHIPDSPSAAKRSSSTSERLVVDYKVRGGRAIGSTNGSECGNSPRDFKVHNGNRPAASFGSRCQEAEGTLRPSFSGVEADGLDSLTNRAHSSSARASLWTEEWKEEPRSNVSSHSTSFASLAAQKLTLLSLKANFSSSHLASLSHQQEGSSPRLSPMIRTKSLPWGSYSYGLAASLSSNKRSQSFSKSTSPSNQLARLSESLPKVEEEGGGGKEEGDGGDLSERGFVEEWEGADDPGLSLMDYAEVMVYQKKAKDIHTAVCLSAAALEQASARCTIEPSEKDAEILYERIRTSVKSSS